MRKVRFYIGITIFVAILAAVRGPFHDLDVDSAWENRWPHLFNVRDCALLLAANMSVAAARGDYESVMKDAALKRNVEADLFAVSPGLLRTSCYL